MEKEKEERGRERADTQVCPYNPVSNRGSYFLKNSLQRVMCRHSKGQCLLANMDR